MLEISSRPAWTSHAFRMMGKFCRWAHAVVSTFTKSPRSAAGRNRAYVYENGTRKETLRSLRLVGESEHQKHN